MNLNSYAGAQNRLQQQISINNEIINDLNNKIDILEKRKVYKNVFSLIIGLVPSVMIGIGSTIILTSLGLPFLTIYCSYFGMVIGSFSISTIMVNLIKKIKFQKKLKVFSKSKTFSQRFEEETKYLTQKESLTCINNTLKMTINKLENEQKKNPNYTQNYNIEDNLAYKKNVLKNIKSLLEQQADLCENIKRISKKKYAYGHIPSCTNKEDKIWGVLLSFFFCFAINCIPCIACSLNAIFSLKTMLLVVAAFSTAMTLCYNAIKIKYQKYYETVFSKLNNEQITEKDNTFSLQHNIELEQKEKMEELSNITLKLEQKKMLVSDEEFGLKRTFIDNNQSNIKHLKRINVLSYQHIPHDIEEKNKDFQLVKKRS